MTAPRLEVSGLNGWYGPAQILFDVGFAVGPGEALALLGRNGAGKSTTFKALCGLLPRREGCVTLAGREIGRLRTHEIARAGLGYVPEDRRIFTGLTVSENLEVGRRPAPDGAVRWTPDRLYDLFPALGAMRSRLGGRMSGGEQQMLAIARTLTGNPRVLLLDEPLEGLAPKVVETLVDAMQALRREGLSLVLSEQNLAVARRVCDSAILLERGQVRFAGTIAELEAEPDVLDAVFAL